MTTDNGHGSRLIHPGYRNGGWHTSSPWWTDGGVRSRVGMRHVPLAELINAVAGSGLHIVKAEEPRTEDVPYILALVARRRPTELEPPPPEPSDESPPPLWPP